MKKIKINSTETILPDQLTEKHFENKHVKTNLSFREGNLSTVIQELIEQKKELESQIAELQLENEITKKNSSRLLKMSLCLSSFGQDHDDNIKSLTNLCGELLSATCALYNRLDDGFLCTHGQWQTPPDFLSKDAPEGHICYDVICNNRDEVFLINDLQHTPYFDSDPNVRKYELQTYCGHVVKCEAKPIGALCVVYQSVFHPTAEDRQILKIISDAIGNEDARKQIDLALIENQRLLTETEAISKVGGWEFNESETRFHTLLDNVSNIAVQGYGPDCIVHYWNKASENVYGYTSKEAIGKNLIDLIIPPTMRTAVMEDIAKMIKSGIGKSAEELHLMRKNGSLIPVLSSHSVIQIPGKDKELFCIDIDLTDRIQVEEALKKSEEKFRTVADFTYDWEFWLVDEDQFYYISPSCERITGYSPKDFMNNPNLLYQIIHRDDLTTYQKHEVFANECKTMHEIDFRIITLNGEDRWINQICQPVFDEKGNSIGIRGSNRDITNRKNAENQIQELNDKLLNLNADKDRFMSILAYDLKSPFSSLLGFLELLTSNIQKYDIDKIEKQITIINNSAQRIYNLLDDIVIWARSQSGKMPYDPQELNLHDICLEILADNKLGADNKNITINHFVAEEITVKADIDMLKTILRNLISNALKFTNNGGQISIYAEKEIDNTTIKVSDNGIGISPTVLNKLFDISQKYSTAGTAGENGTGFGLFLCKEFIEKHDGKICIESELGKGSTFMFKLPS